MKRISLDEASACQAHASLHDDSTPLAAIIADTRAALATGPVTWQVTITPRNVHCVESLLLMSQITGCTLAPEPAPELGARERAFLEDVLTHYAQSASAQQEPSGPGLSGYMDFARDCLKVLLGMLPAALRRQEWRYRRRVHRRRRRSVWHGEVAGR